MLTRHARRLDASQLSGLQGGLIDGKRHAGIPALMAALAMPGADGTTRYRYDRSGRLLDITDALGQRIAHRYNAFGELAGRTLIGSELGDIAEERHYDRRGLLLSELRDATGLRARARFQYDAFGRVTGSTDANGNVRQQHYDRLGRIVQTVDATGALAATGYDAFARVISRSDALGHTTTIAWDHVARSSTVTTPEGIIVTTVMNRHGQTQSVTDGNGNVTSYAYDRNGNLVSTATPLAQTTQRFDAGNRLVETIGGNGVHTVLAYDAASRVITRIVDPDGLALATAYVHDALGRMVRSTDANGIATTYRHGASGQLLEQVRDPGGLALATRYRWNSRGQQLSVTDANGIVTRHAWDSLGRRTSEIIDPNGLALTTTYAWDAKGNLVTRTDANGRVSRHAHDAENRPVASVDAAGGVTITTYDPNGRIASTVAYATPIMLDGLPPAPSLADITARIRPDASDQSSHRVYDRDGRLAFTVDGVGAVVAYRYDGNGNVTGRRAYARPIDPAGWQPGTLPAVQADDARDQRLRTLYDAASRAIASTDGVGALTVQRYDPNGNLLSRTEWAEPLSGALADYQPGGQALLLREASGNALGSQAATVLQWAMPAPDVVAVLSMRLPGSEDWTEVPVQTEVIGSNTQGQPVGLQKAGLSHLAPGSYEISLRFYRDGELVARASGSLDLAADTSQSSYTEAIPEDYQPGYTIAASGPRTAISTDQATRVELRQRLDRWGNVLAVNDPRSPQWITQTRHNRFDQVVGQIQPEADLATGGSTAPATRFGYDLLGRQIARSDANGNLTRQVHDAAGQLVEERHADGGIVRHAYDAFGNEVSQTDPNGNVTRHAYDRLGRRVATVHAAVQAAAVVDGPSMRLPDARLFAGLAISGEPVLQQRGMQALTETFAYDEAGRRIASTNGNGETIRSRYDLRGNLIEQTDALGQRTLFTWDEHNRQASRTDANGRTAAWRHDDFGRLLAHTDIGGAAYDYQYDHAGQLLRQANSRGQDLRYRYDPSGLLLAIDDIATGKHSTYRYDAAGRRIAERTEQAGVLYQDNLLRYDSLGRLVQVTDSSAGRAEVRIGYDAAGNRVRISTDIDSGGVTRQDDGWYRYDSMNRQIVVNAIDAEGKLGRQGRRIAWDLAGNRISGTW